jgi:hypothetical protein
MLIAFIRSRNMSEEEMIRLQDLAIGESGKDPKEMARWVP